MRAYPIRAWKAFEAIALVAALVGISFLILVTDLPILFLTLPVLGWAAWRFQQPGAAPRHWWCRVRDWAAVEQRGLFTGLTLSEEMFTLQAFNATVALTSFFFARS